MDVIFKYSLVLFLRGEVKEEVWRFLLTGGVALDNPHPNPFPQWLGDKSWGEIVRASELRKLKGWFKGTRMQCMLREFLNVLTIDFSIKWKDVYDSLSPHKAKLPKPWNKVKGLERLVHGYRYLLIDYNCCCCCC